MRDPPAVGRPRPAAHRVPARGPGVLARRGSLLIAPDSLRHGIELRLSATADSIDVAKVVTAVLANTHKNVQDFSVTIPAALLTQQQGTQTMFTNVMVVIAAISLLVGGIGIMNIVLATVMERTREIGIRRSIGARQFDIVRQFLTESVQISVGGGLLGIAFGFFLAWLIARTAEWKTIVTTASVVIAFGVSVFVGVVFGIYPAVKASGINRHAYRECVRRQSRSLTTGQALGGRWPKRTILVSRKAQC